jgi:hypothetical protein
MLRRGEVADSLRPAAITMERTMTEFQLDGEAVLKRTEAGQRAVFDIELDEPRRRLLLLVNGYTPFSSLTARLDPRDDWRAAAHTLIQRRLVSVDEPLDNDTGEEPSSSSPSASPAPLAAG